MTKYGKKPDREMDLLEFGEGLLDLNDLDPVYVCLYNSQLKKSRGNLKKWLLAYWCFYHMGTASWIVNRTKAGSCFWGKMSRATASREYLRNRERRHFRGENATKSVAYLRSRGIDDLFQGLTGGPYTMDEVMSRVQEWVGFGPWIAFKVVDMLERLDLAEIEVTDEDVFLFDSPREGAEIAARRYAGESVTDPSGWAVEHLLEHFGHRDAPPGYERKFGPQEAETILCKWKSHLNGKYHLGEDVEGCRRDLLSRSRCRIAQDLLRGGSKGGLW